MDKRTNMQFSIAALLAATFWFAVLLSTALAINGLRTQRGWHPFFGTWTTIGNEANS